MAHSFEDAKEIANEIGYPVLVRPSYVLGGRGMEIVYNDEALKYYIENSAQISPDLPVLVDRFLDDAIEIDVDALYDGKELYLGGVMEHIEEAGVHSGDSSCTLPAATLGRSVIEEIRHATEEIAKGVGVRGLVNIQYALVSDMLYVIEANPRASRTVPFVSKATNTQLAKAATLIMLGKSIADLRKEGWLRPEHDGAFTWRGMPISVKEAVLPFSRFQTPEGRTVDSILGPEMRSTGEVMGLDTSYGVAYAKSQSAIYGSMPTSGKVFVSVANRDKRNIISRSKYSLTWASRCWQQKAPHRCSTCTEYLSLRCANTLRASDLTVNQPSPISSKTAKSPSSLIRQPAKLAAALHELMVI